VEFIRKINLGKNGTKLGTKHSMTMPTGSIGFSTVLSGLVLQDLL
jgi:hypothetical protein